MSFFSKTALTEEKYIPPSLKWMFIVAGVLIAIGVINVYSATYYMNVKMGVNPYGHFIRHIIYLVIGVVAGGFAAKCPKNWIRGYAFWWSFVTVGLLIGVALFGTNVNGATRWIYLGSFSLQPSEIAKVTALIWAAALLATHVVKGEKITLIERFLRPFIHFSDRKKKENTFQSMLCYFMPLYAPLIMAVFVLKQPDMGTASIILAFPVALYILAGLPWSELIKGSILLVGMVAVLIVTAPYRLQRVMVLIDPFSDPTDKGYQTVQSLIAVGSGGLLGQSFGEGMSKFLYLPEQFTDFAFAVFSQEFGFIGSVTLLILYLAFFLFGFSVARELKEIYAALLVYGLTMLISVQGILNIAMVIGCFPVTGVPLPFISFGGSSLVMNVITLGLIWGTTVQSLAETDWEERRRRINAMEGRG